MLEEEMEKLTRKISNAIWKEIKDYAQSGQTFEWEVIFKEHTGKEVELGE